MAVLVEQRVQAQRHVATRQQREAVVEHVPQRLDENEEHVVAKVLHVGQQAGQVRGDAAPCQRRRVFGVLGQLADESQKHLEQVCRPRRVRVLVKHSRAAIATCASDSSIVASANSRSAVTARHAALRLGVAAVCIARSVVLAARRCFVGVFSLQYDATSPQGPLLVAIRSCLVGAQRVVAVLVVAPQLVDLGAGSHDYVLHCTAQLQGTLVRVPGAGAVVVGILDTRVGDRPTEATLVGVAPHACGKHAQRLCRDEVDVRVRKVEQLAQRLYERRDKVEPAQLLIRLGRHER
mmetsp:Transcript_18249/g.64661  ORF Transcript_18249/g.64661 Transcript_18249/m.64661 type:complete len:293 (-) Transcript_18249:391-1269(-)